MRAIVCDKCDRILPPDGAYREVLTNYAKAEGCDYHLCLDCVKRFEEWLEEKAE